ncbi:hypothetical protein IIC38_19600 [candidate division KSB1 bacterium]|nr:hypothetical protein [candidate division KSB1 bacterium]
MVLDGENRGGDERAITIITFPAQGMQDLLLFAEKGFLEFRDTETEDYFLTKGKIVCFEKSSIIWLYLKKKLVNATVERNFEKYISNNVKGIAKGSINIFPVDCINLDYDGNISKNEVSISIIIKHLFSFQVKHKKDFCLFLTWPKPHEEAHDEPDYLNNLKRIIRNNLSDPNTQDFAQLFNEKYESIENTAYEFISIVGLSKQILKESTSHGFQLQNNEFFFYGEEGRQPMMSVLYYFKFIDEEKPQHQIYSEDVARTLIRIQTLD